MVAVDDGSTDDTNGVLREASRQWGTGPPALLVHRHEERRGIAAALATAAGLAGDAPFLARQDADDVSCPRRLETQLAWLEARPRWGVVATGVTTDSEMPPTDGWARYEAWLASLHEPEEIARDLWIESPLPHPTVVMRRAAFELAGGYREVPWPEDYDLWLRMLRRGILMGKVPEVLYRWTDHPGRLSRTHPSYSPDAFLKCRVHHFSRFMDERLGGDRPIVIWGAGRDGRRAARQLLSEGRRIIAFLDIDPRKIGRRAYQRPILSAEGYLAEGSIRVTMPAMDGTTAGNGLGNGLGPEANGEGTDRVTTSIEPDGPRPARPSEGEPLVIACVGTPGARELIRARLAAASFVEGRDYFCFA